MFERPYLKFFWIINRTISYYVNHTIGTLFKSLHNRHTDGQCTWRILYVFIILFGFPKFCSVFLLFLCGSFWITRLFTIPCKLYELTVPYKRGDYPYYTFRRPKHVGKDGSSQEQLKKFLWTYETDTTERYLVVALNLLAVNLLKWLGYFVCTDTSNTMSIYVTSGLTCSSTLIIYVFDPRPVSVRVRFQT